MLLTFPELLTFGVFGLLALRLALGAFFLMASIDRLSLQNRNTAKQDLLAQWPAIAGAAVWYAGIIEFIIGILFILGFLTQIAGLLGVIYAVKLLIIQETRVSTLARHDTFIYIFVFAASLALTFLGPGIFGIDLPL